MQSKLLPPFLSLSLSLSPNWYFPFPLCGKSRKKQKVNHTFPRTCGVSLIWRWTSFFHAQFHCFSFSHAAFTRRPLIQSNSYSREIIIYRLVLSMCLKKKKKERKKNLTPDGTLCSLQYVVMTTVCVMFSSLWYLSSGRLGEFSRSIINLSVFIVHLYHKPYTVGAFIPTDIY